MTEYFATISPETVSIFLLGDDMVFYEALRTAKQPDIIRLAKDALNGLVRVPAADGTMYDIIDHAWLLDFASRCAHTAHLMEVGSMELMGG